MIPEWTFPDPDGVSRTEIRVSDEGGAALLKRSDLPQLPVEKILILDTQKTDDDSAPQGGGAVFRTPSHEDVSGKEGQIADERSPASPDPAFSQRKIEGNPCAI